MIAVVFGQFSDLTFLQDKLGWFAWPVSFFVVVYAFIVAAGFYFSLRFLRFSRLLDEEIARKRRLASKLGPDRLRRVATSDEGQAVALSIYLLLSIIALPAVLLLPK